jgi:hypothetical protein
MSVYCGECQHADECGDHPERFMDCQDNAARFAIRDAAPEMYAALDSARSMLTELAAYSDQMCRIGRGFDGTNDDGDGLERVATYIRTALAHARGES